MTITTKMPKADVLAAYKTLEAEHQAFRQTVVTEALKAAKQHNLCGVVQQTLIKVGVADLLPPVIELQSKNGSGARWYEDEVYDDLAKAIKDAKSYNTHNLRNAQERARWRAAGGGVSSDYLTVHRGESLEHVIAEVKKMHSRLNPPTTPVTVDPKDVYPQYRVVRRYPGQKKALEVIPLD